MHQIPCPDHLEKRNDSFNTSLLKPQLSLGLCALMVTILKVCLEKLNEDEMRKDSANLVFWGKGKVDVVQGAWLCVPMGCTCQSLQLEYFLAGCFLPLTSFSQISLSGYFSSWKTFPFPFCRAVFKQYRSSSFPLYTGHAFPPAHFCF